MSLKNILNQNLVSCDESASVYDVASLMRDKDVGAVLVLNEDEAPCGIITDRDLIVRCLADKGDCEQIRVSDVMTATVECASEEDGIFNVIEKMKKANARRIPIVDSQGKAVSLLSFDDVFELIAEEMGNLKDAIKPAENKIQRQAA